jgi:hypothetical protein
MSRSSFCFCALLVSLLNATSIMAADTIGIPTCDAFLAQYRACIDSKMPAEWQIPYSSRLEEKLKNWNNYLQRWQWPGLREEFKAVCLKEIEKIQSEFQKFGCPMELDSKFERAARHDESVPAAAGNSKAESTVSSPKNLISIFQEALLGYCYSTVFGKTLLKSSVDPSRWKKTTLAHNAGTSVLGANARERRTKSGRVIVDRTPNTCSVQVRGADNTTLIKTIDDLFQEPLFKPWGWGTPDGWIDDNDRLSGPARGMRAGIFHHTFDSDPWRTIIITYPLPPAHGAVTGHIMLTYLSPKAPKIQCLRVYSRMPRQQRPRAIYHRSSRRLPVAIQRLTGVDPYCQVDTF